MTNKHASYTFGYVDPTSGDDPVVHKFVLDSPEDMPTFDSVTQAFLGFLSEVHGYEITVDRLMEQTATA